MWILDASVAIKWFAKEELHREQALRVLQKVVDSPDQFAVPNLFFYEISHVLLKKSAWDFEFAQESLNTLYQFGLPTIDMGQELSDLALQTACRYRLSFYDAAYVAAAQLTSARWLTADGKASRRLDRNLFQELSGFVSQGN